MSSDPSNPYASPVSDPVLPQEIPNELPLATLGDRFAGAFIDGLINFGLAMGIFAIMLVAGIVGSFGEFGRMGIVQNLGMSFATFVLFVLVQYKSLKATGQTIGKKVAKTKIVTMTGEKPEITDLIAKRYAFMQLIALIPVVGGLVSLVGILMIFGKSRRCLHDLIAGTKVVKAL